MGKILILLVAGLLCSSASTPVQAARSDVVDLHGALVAAPLSFQPQYFAGSGIALADKSQAGTHDAPLPIVLGIQVTDASNIGLPVRVGSERVDANSEFARSRPDDVAVGNLSASALGLSAKSGLRGVFSDFDMRRIPGWGGLAAIIGLIGSGLFLSGFKLGGRRLPQAPSSGHSFVDQAEAVIAPVWSEGRFHNTISIGAGLDTGVVADALYGMFTLDGRSIRSFRDFIAADDSAAISQARRCEPTEAFELWRGNLCITWQPQIQKPQEMYQHEVSVNRF